MDHNGVSWRRVCSGFGRCIDYTDYVIMTLPILVSERV